MTWVAAAIGGATLITGLIGADAQRSAGNKAADSQQRMNDADLAQRQAQFDAIMKLLAPYNAGGQKAFGGQLDLAGANGAKPQQAAIDMIKSSPAFTSALQLGNDSILSNASATGGLRGGNTEAALMQYSPQLLAQAINDHFNQLGALTSVGENAAAMTGNAGAHNADAISAILQNNGAIGAGRALSGGAANAGAIGAFGQGLGSYFGAGGRFGMGGNGSQFTGQPGYSSVDWGIGGSF